MSQRLQWSLRHVFWIGGAACGGKTSTAQGLAHDYSLRVYSCDESYAAHRRRVDQRRHPHFHRIMHKNSNQLFMPPAEAQVAELVGFYQEQFDMVFADVLALPRSSPILVEGAGLLPSRVFAVLANAHQAVWLVPTAEFRATLTRLDDPAVWELVGATDDPRQAFQNWMRRDVLFAQRIVAEAQALGLQVLVNDGHQTIPQRTATVAQHFGW